MNNLKLLGSLYQTSEGDVVFIPVKTLTVSNTKPEDGKPGRIVRQPTPEDVGITKEEKADYSLEGVLKKTKKDEVL